MVTSQNLEDLRGDGHGYIVGRNRRRSGEAFDYIRDRPLDRTSRRHHGPREGDTAQDAGSGS
jgi:hypothetical protein